MKANLTYILLIFYLFRFQISSAQEPLKEGNLSQPVLTKNKLPKKEANVKVDSLLNKKADTVPTDSIKKPKEVIDYIVTHNAEDYTIQNAKNKTITLYNKAHVVYGDIDLKAGKIIVDYKNNTVYATGIKDSTGTKYIQRPVFKQGSQESEQDSILFNFKTQKALVYGVKTVQGEMITYGEKTKRVNDSTIYMRKLRFTTSKKDNPDYYIATNKAKLVPGKKIIVGGSQLVIADVPTPLYLPFAYFPLTEKRSSGFIIPSWGENNQQGFFLQNGGYYFAINDYVDLETTADIYTNGSWGINLSSNYYVRYKFSGGFSFRYQNLINSIRGFSDYSKTSNYNINWRHSQDAKSSPNSRFTASVNLSGSGQFFRQSLNEIDNSQLLRNQFNSSINYYKKFVGTPFNMSLTATHNQSSSSKVINMTLPSLQVNMDRIFPFKGKGGVKKNAIQKIGVNYNLRGEYRINTTEDEFFTSKMFKEAKSAMRHTLSANTNMKAFKYFTLSPSLNYEDTWYFDRIVKRYDPRALNSNGFLGDAVNDTISGFNRYNQYNAGVTLSTNIYGTFNFKKGRLKALRHTVRPSVTWSYRPDFASKHEIKVRQSANPDDILTYTPFDEGIYGGPSSGVSNLLSFSVNNVLEAKMAPKDPDSDEEDKKVTILNNLNFSTSYNMAADSLRWSNVSFSAGTRLFKEKMAVNLSGSLDPYQVTSTGVRINKFNRNLFRLNQARLTANYSISNKDFDKNSKNDNTSNSGNSQAPPDVYTSNIDPTNRFATQQPNNRGNKKDNKKETKLYRANIPWNLRLDYGIGYRNNGYNVDEFQNHTIGFDGDVELSPKWKVGFSSVYNFDEGAFSYTRLNFSRDLDSWRFNFNWIPFGPRSSYNFFIGVKSSMLSDLKWDKNKPPDRRLF